MDDPETSRDRRGMDAASRSREVVRQFVEHWGMMARAWGINPTMGELFALLYITGTDWTAEELKDWLRVSRGNVSMNLRELLAWGVVRKLHRPGERRELFHAETEVWTLFRRILKERKRRELDPTLIVLDRIFRLSETEPEMHDLKAAGRVAPPLLRADRRPASRLLSLDEAEMADLGQFFAESEDDTGPGRRDPKIDPEIPPLFDAASRTKTSSQAPLGRIVLPNTRKRPARLFAHLWAEGVDNSPWG